jgi:hypothetical protein
MVSSMASFKPGDRIRILESSPVTWHKPATILEVWEDSTDDAQRIYRIQLDEGTFRRIRGRDIEPLEEEPQKQSNGTEG